MDVDISRFRVEPGTTIDLSEVPTEVDDGLSEDDIEDLVDDLNSELEDLQELLYAEGRHRLLIVLQAIDAGGKDGTIRHVFDGVNPQGVKVASFKRPTDLELAHDYLWRVHPHVPGNGEIVIFNRSHYEDVLVVRVHGLVPEDRWRRRYAHINDFERMLADEGTTILKFFLHISKNEQKRRFQSRLDEEHKNWKFSKGDLAERRRWDDYRAAFEEMLERTSQERAPWFVVPADNKDYRNLVISTAIVGTLRDLDMSWPDPEEDLDDVEIPD